MTTLACISILCFFRLDETVDNQSDAFLSYTRIDDQFFGGAITSLRKLLELGVQVVTGHKNFNIFQDVDGIEFGQNWQQRLDQAISSTRFLIPFITPLFFQSQACRDELKKFFDHEKQLGRDDLILPVYFVTAPVLEKQELLRADPLASAINARQRYDWRSKADLPISDPQIRSAVIDLSQKISSAIARTEISATRTQAKHGYPVEAIPNSGLSEAAKNEESRKKTKAQRKILWVDDRPDNNVFERRSMQSYYIEFELAETTGQALAKLRNTKFDAIISDMGRPPDMQAGYTLLDAVRGSGDPTPFFIYAGSNSPEHLRLAMSKGAQWSTNRADTLISKILESLDE
jgi:CheY-like chemotaxis protein